MQIKDRLHYNVGMPNPLLLLTALAALPQSLISQTVPWGQIDGVFPGYAIAGGSSLTLQVLPYGPPPQASAGMVLRWNGSERSTSLQGAHMEAEITSSDIASPGLAEIALYYPEFGLTVPGTVLFPVAVNVNATNIVYDETRNLFYASLWVDRFTDSPDQVIAAMDPETGKAVSAVSVGTGSATAMAISGDGHYLYVGFDRKAAVCRVDLTSFAPDMRFEVGPPGTSVMDLKVLPGRPGSIAVSWTSAVSIYDNGVKRPVEFTHGFPSVTFGNDASTLYGEEGTMKLDSNGVTGVLNTITCCVLWTCGGIQYANGRLYCRSGVIYDADWKQVGSFGEGGDFAVDPKQNRILYFVRSASGLRAFNLTDQLPYGVLPILKGVRFDPYRVAKVIRWGTNGVAFLVPAAASETAILLVFHTPFAGPAPAFKIDSVLDSGTAMSGPISAGQLLTIIGSNLGPATPRQVEYLYPGQPYSTLAGVQVLFNATPAQLLSVQSDRIDLIVPPLPSDPIVKVQVVNTGIPSAQVEVPVQ